MLTDFFHLVENQFFTSVKTFRSDNGFEFCNTLYSNLFKTKGIIHQNSCVHTPQQNRVVESKYRHLLDVARALRFQANIPLRFLGDCILTITYIINRLPSTILNEKYPYEIFHGKPLSFDHIKSLGCLNYATKPDFHDKFTSKSILVVFMGDAPIQKGYKVYDIEVKMFLVISDVVFKEKVFPFKHPKSNFLDGSDSIPSCPTSDIFPTSDVQSTVPPSSCVDPLALPDDSFSSPDSSPRSSSSSPATHTSSPYPSSAGPAARTSLSPFAN